MDNEKAFEIAMKMHGKPVRIFELPDNLSRGLKEQLALFQSLAPFAHCGFLDNANFNAVAAARNGKEFIGIYLGATFLVARYAYCLLSDPDMFPCIGDASAEAIEPQVIEELRCPLGTFSLLRYLPRDPVRLLAAQHLAACAYLILFAHEMAHLELCHLSFLRDELGLEEHQEVTAMPLSEDEALLFRTLEWDADNSSLMTSLKVWRHIFPSRIDFSAIATLGAVRSWFIAAQLLFWVMDFIQPQERKGLLATHPSPHARFVNARMLATSFGLVPELSDEGHTTEDTLSNWVVKNSFPSKMVDDARAVNSLDGVVQELVATKENYERMMGRLASYQAARLSARGVTPPVFPRR